MNRVYLDCSGLRDIRLNASDLPASIQIDGQHFINCLNEAIQTIPQPEYIELSSVTGTILFEKSQFSTIQTFNGKNYLYLKMMEEGNSFTAIIDDENKQKLLKFLGITQ